MKKFFVYLFLALFVAVPAFAAGTVTLSSDKIHKISQDESIRVVTFACVGDDSDGSIPDTTISKANFSGLARPFHGWYLYRAIIHNSTTQTDCDNNSDVYLKDSGADDYLGGQGVDQLDADTYNKITINTVEAFYDNPILDVDNQSAVEAEYSIKFVLVK